MDEFTIRDFLVRHYPRVVAGLALTCDSRALAAALGGTGARMEEEANDRVEP